MTPEELRPLLDEEQTRRGDPIELTVADRLDDDREDDRLFGGLL